MQVAKWGNSLAIRLPATVVETLNLKPGDEISVTIAGDRNFLVEREPTRQELIDQIRRMARPLPPGFKFDRHQANAR